MMDHGALYHWLALSRIPAVGRVIYKRLLEAFGSPERVFEADYGSLLEIEGIRKASARAIGQFKKNQAIDRELDQLEALGIGLLTLADPLYPPLLAQIYDPPPFLYFRGNPSNQDARCLAVVGSRHGSPYGVKVTERLAWSLSKHHLTIVSGMARGIDTAAHRGSLMARGRTVAVLGSGLDRVYPPENRELYDQIAEQGMVCTEYPLGTLPERQNFPVRNRIISGMSLGVVIVEATQRSGSLITARLALDQGREVFAVPGSIESFKSSGTHRLIKQGAKLVEHAQDVLDEIGQPRAEVLMPEPDEQKAPWSPALSPDQKRIWDLLSGDPLHVDQMVRESRLGIAPLLSLLLEMELQGWIQQLPGKYFIRKPL